MPWSRYFIPSSRTDAPGDKGVVGRARDAGLEKVDGLVKQAMLAPEVARYLPRQGFQQASSKGDGVPRSAASPIIDIQANELGQSPQRQRRQPVLPNTRMLTTLQEEAPSHTSRWG